MKMHYPVEGTEEKKTADLLGLADDEEKEPVETSLLRMATQQQDI